jgi:hypothetical protein
VSSWDGATLRSESVPSPPAAPPDPTSDLKAWWLSLTDDDRDQLMALCCRHCGRVVVTYPPCSCTWDD